MKQLDRRTLLKGLNTLFIMLALPFSTAKKVLARVFPTRTVEVKDFTFDPGTGTIRRAGRNQTESYNLVIDGLVEKPMKLDYAALRKIPSVTQTSDFHCVEGWTIPQVTWSGFRFRDLVAMVNPKKEATYVTFSSLGETRYKPGGRKNYVESFKLDGLLDTEEEILLALDKDGKPLSQDRGAPLRVIAPHRLGYKSIKFVNRIEFTDEKQLGWWTLANPIYSWEAYVGKRK